MTTMLKLYPSFLFALSVLVLLSMTTAIAQEGLLDGKIFVGQARERHIKKVNDDELKFVKGEFYSSFYAQRGFSEGVYTAREEADKIYFEAETMNPKQGNIKWRGVVRGDSIDVNFQWRKKGWLSNTEIDYSFSGELKK